MELIAFGGHGLCTFTIRDRTCSLEAFEVFWPVGIHATGIDLVAYQQERRKVRSDRIMIEMLKAMSRQPIHARAAAKSSCSKRYEVVPVEEYKKVYKGRIYVNNVESLPAYSVSILE